MFATAAIIKRTWSRMSADFVAIDFETANEYRGSPCSVGLISVVSGRIDSVWSSYICPPQGAEAFSSRNIGIHGIRPGDVQDAPDWPLALKDILAFVGERPIIAHNAAFDVGVIRDACQVTQTPWPDLTYACSLVVARRTWKLESYSLQWVTDEIGHSMDRHHEAQADAHAAAAITLKAIEAHRASSLDALLSGLRVTPGRLSAAEWSGCHLQGVRRAALPGANPDADPNGPFFGMTVCITGDLRPLGYTRPEAQQAIADRGGRPVDNPTKTTDILILADQDPKRFRPGMTKSGKHLKGEKLRAAGHDIEIITGADFLERLISSD